MRLRQISRRWLLALLTPALLGLYSFLPWLVPLGLFALVPWIVLYTDDRHPRVSFGYFVVAALVTMPLLYPVIFRFGWHFPIAFSLTFMVPWLLFAPLMRRVHHRLHLPRALTFPILWVTVEWVRATLSLSHFDLFRLGYTQAPLTPLIQIADITGVYGVSFLVAAVNGLLADVYFSVREHGWRSAGGWLSRRNLIAAGAVAVAFVAALVYGAVRLSGATYEEGPRIAVVQPNIRHRNSNAVGVHVAQVLMTDEEVAPGAADLIVWPENSILDNLRRPGAYLEDLAWLADRKSSMFLVGALGKPPERPGRTTNGAFLVDREGEVLGEYAKQVLFPWSEYVPLDDVLGRVSNAMQQLQRTLVRRGWGFMPAGVPGDRTVLLRLPWQGGELPFGVLICVENAYPPVPAEAGRMGARFFVNITSEGEVGGPLQEHLLRTAMLRATENRIAYVRAGNTGVSGFIDPAGRLQSLLIGRRGGTILDSGVLIDRVPLSDGGPTIYARSRDAFAKTCIVATLILLGWTWIGGRRATVAAVAALACLSALSSGCAGAPSIGDDVDNAGQAFKDGRRSFSEGRMSDALAEFAAACADRVACRKSLDMAGRAFVRNQRPEAGADFFAAVAERHPELAGDALGYRGNMLDQSLAQESAESSYEQAIELSPDARWFGRLGSLRLRLEKPAAAIEAYRDGLALNPEDAQLRYLLGRALRITHQYDEAARIFEDLLAEQPDHSYAWTNLGRVRLAQGAAEEGERALLHSIELDATNIESRFQLVKIALRAGRTDEAKRWLQEILAVEQRLGGAPGLEDG